jgi:uncharacterized protein YjbJ (UPF0337 family)
MNFEWAHLMIALSSAGVGALTGLVVGVWRVARIEGQIKDDFKNCIQETKAEIEGRVEALVGQFQDTFAALRQKINDVELQTERLFVSKSGFDEFRKEYREDMASLMRKIDHITVRTDR